jgi:polygalacturonase
LHLPAGDYFSAGPLYLKSHTDLHLAAGATLRFSPDPADYLPVVFTRWEGIELYNYSPLIYVVEQTDVALTGEGTIDGQAHEIWAPWAKLQQPAKLIARRMSEEQVPVEARRFGPGRFLRPSMIQFIHCQRVLVEGLSITRSPLWIVHPIYSSDLIFRDLRIRSRVINNDGIDLDSSDEVLIEGCSFVTGDDAIAIKSGRDQDGWRVERPSRDIVIRNCDMAEVLHGLACGSEMSGGVSDVYAYDLRVGRVADKVLQFKANKDRGGYVRDIFIQQVAVDSALGSLVDFTNDYHGYRGGNAPSRFANIQIEDVSCTYARQGFVLNGLEESPLDSLFFARIHIDHCEQPVQLQSVAKLESREVWVNGEKIDWGR